MPEWIKNIFGAAVGLGFWLLMVGVLCIGVVGIVWFTEYFVDWLAVLNQLTTAALVLLLIASFFPRARAFTGNAIVFCSYIFGSLLWLFSLVVTYEYWGILGVFIGAVLLGVGIFATGLFALLIYEGFLSALFIVFSLLVVYGIRMLGYWILSKYRPKSQYRDELMDRIVSGKADVADWMEADGHITHESNLAIKAKEEKN